VKTRHMKIILFALCASLVAACATTSEPVRPPVNVEIQEQVGFTITEEARIGGDVRADYETALSYLQQGRHDEGIELLEQVATAAPELSAPRIDLGIAQHRAGDLEAAEKNLLLALESNPEQPVYLADLECALGNYEAYMKTVPSDEEASMWIADIRYRLDQ
jgi:tetratricopeptide (TPR) repeat protein